MTTLLWISVLKVPYLDIQGDEFDSSDEEWDQHIGRHARAFLGLNEPIAKIALDDGIGIGMMVRIAFALVNNIHMRAAMAECPSTAVAEGSPSHLQPDAVGFPDNVDNMIVGEEGEDIVESLTRPLHSNCSNDDNQEPCQHGGNNVDGTKLFCERGAMSGER